MDHLEAAGALPNLAEATQVHAGLELRLLLAREVKEAERKLARAVAEEMSADEETLREIALATLLRDIGNVTLDPELVFTDSDDCLRSDALSSIALLLSAINYMAG